MTSRKCPSWTVSQFSWRKSTNGDAGKYMHMRTKTAARIAEIEVVNRQWWMMVAGNFSIK